MLKRNELLYENSCLNQACDDEPIFVLRANDELAPSAVRWWVQRYADAKGGMTPRQREKCIEALALAGRMEEWKRKNPK